MNDEYNMSGKQNIIPDASGLFFALRSMGYENTAAVADLIDNSIDAGASKVWLEIDEDLSRIFIADDGSGMSQEVLRNAIRLGGKKAHDNSTDLGKYGLGLITASLSMGRVVRIITKNNNEYNTAVMDYNEIQNTNLFNADFYPSTGTEKISFDYRTENADSGTVLIIEDCDKIQYKTLSKFENDLHSGLGEVFRSFIENNLHIFINKKIVKAKEVFYLDYKDTKILKEDDIEIDKGDGTTGKIHVMAVELHDFGGATNKSLHINIARQGFYVLRNGREIAAALEYPEIFHKHNSLNRLRIQLSFSPELDDVMGINLKKHDVAPSKEVINALKNLLEETIKDFRNRNDKKTKKGKNPFNEGKTEPSDEPTSPVTSVVTSQNGGKTEENDSTPKEYTFNFLNYAGTEEEPFCKASVSDNKISIRYNVKNVFYQEYIINRDNGNEIKKIMDSLIEASAKAYIKTSGTDVERFINDIAENFNDED